MAILLRNIPIPEMHKRLREYIVGRFVNAARTNQDTRLLAAIAGDIKNNNSIEYGKIH